jgi:hypothetical protein
MDFAEKILTAPPRDAWVRHVLAPDGPDLKAYVNHSLPEGTTGDR